MPAIREVLLNLAELESMIRAFEEKYGLSSADFLRDAGRGVVISEDDSFKWEAFIDHRRELLRADEETHSGYLSDLRKPAKKQSKASPIDDVLALAA